MRRYSHGRGFTLVELLVVIAIIGTLVALLLPAVQGAREQARRASCSNNLHNLALAAQQYHTNMGSYPSGWICATDPGARNEYSGVALGMEGFGWGALLLPFLEQKALHKQIGVSGYQSPTQGTISRLDLSLNEVQIEFNNNSSSPVGDAMSTPLKLFMCASDTGFSGRGQVDSSRQFTRMPTAGVSNYVGVAGHRFVTGTVRNTGILYGNSYVRDADILDGLSNTAMFGERDTQICHSGTWLGVENPAGAPLSDPSTGQVAASGFTHVTGFSYPKLNVPDFLYAPPPSNLPHQVPQIVSLTGCGAGFSSNHPGGAMFAFADGGVRFILNGIEWRYLPVTGPGTPPGDVFNHKMQWNSQYNGVYQAIMSINDKVPTGNIGN